MESQGLWQWCQGSQDGHEGGQPADEGAGSETGSMEWDDGWVVPDPLFEAEMTYRVRSTSCTPLEWSKLVGSEEEMQFPRQYLSKVTRHWGKPTVISETKALLACVSTHRNYCLGEALEPGSVGFILSKCLIAANRPPPENLTPSHCFCLPITFLEGCSHGCPPLHTSRLKLKDTFCEMCTKCLRCGKLLE